MANLKNLKQVDIYTDGACSGNPGVGGWASILSYGNAEKVIVGGEEQTTNNQMELTAIINGLSALKEKCAVTVYSDSSYSLNPFLEGYIYSWVTSGWKLADKKPVKNVELWKTLLLLVNKHEVTFVKVKGHADNEKNNRCDALARAEINKIKAKLVKID